MKLLFDQNLSFKLVESLSDIFPDSSHVRMLDFEESSDRQIWDFAKEGDYIIVSKDSDFHQFSFLYDPPPKVIWISKGNCKTADIVKALRKHESDIKKFANDTEVSFLEIN